MAMPSTKIMAWNFSGAVAGTVTCVARATCRIASAARAAVTGTPAGAVCCFLVTWASGAPPPRVRRPAVLTARSARMLMPQLASTGPAAAGMPTPLPATSTARYCACLCWANYDSVHEVKGFFCCPGFKVLILLFVENVCLGGATTYAHTGIAGPICCWLASDAWYCGRWRGWALAARCDELHLCHL